MSQNMENKFAQIENIIREFKDEFINPEVEFKRAEGDPSDESAIDVISGEEDHRSPEDEAYNKTSGDIYWYDKTGALLTGAVGESFTTGGKMFVYLTSDNGFPEVGDMVSGVEPSDDESAAGELPAPHFKVKGANPDGGELLLVNG